MYMSAHRATGQHLGLRAVRSLGSCGSLIFSCTCIFRVHLHLSMNLCITLYRIRDSESCAELLLERMDTVDIKDSGGRLAWRSLITCSVSHIIRN